MMIWIDADAAPREVKDIVFRASKRTGAQVTLVANQRLPLPATARISLVIVGADANAADQFIVENATEGDLAITADIPLAAKLVGKNLFVVDPHGEEYHANNIAAKLSMRNFLDEMRGAGESIRGKPPYSSKDKQAFAKVFDRLLHIAMKR